MAREFPGYRDALERIRKESKGEMVTVKEAAQISGITEKRVTQYFEGWYGTYRDKRIPATVLARQMCG